MAVHAKLSASGAHRWMTCPGSIRMEKAYPDTSSSFAQEGTAAHALAELCLHKNKNTEHFFEHTIEGLTVDREMVESVQTYLDYVRCLKGHCFVEQRVNFSDWVPGGFGTSDFICFNGSECTIVDLKYGKGVPVEAENNPQIMLYALGALQEYGFVFDIKCFKLVVHQPRLDSVSEWRITKEDLLAFGKKAKKAAKWALLDDAPLMPSTKACRFCRARGSCRALAEHNFALAVEDFKTLEEPFCPKKTEHLEGSALGKLLEDLEIFTGWVDKVRAHASDIIMRGGTVPGFKMVEGRTNRKWADEERAGKALARKLTVKGAYEKRLITITKAEALLGKEHPLIEKHTVKPPGKPMLAPLSSKKPALEFNIADDFKDIEGVESVIEAA